LPMVTKAPWPISSVSPSQQLAPTQEDNTNDIFLQLKQKAGWDPRYS
jgi:hypothetical protein